MPFLGKRRRGNFLVLGKKQRLVFNPAATSTPAKPSKKTLLIRTPGKSPAYKRKCVSLRKSTLLLFTRDSEYDTECEDVTWLYSDDKSTVIEDTTNANKSRKSLSFQVTSDPLELSNSNRPDNSDPTGGITKPITSPEGRTTHELIDDVITALESHGIQSDFITFLKLVADGKFPLNNVAFMLFLDVVKWFDSKDIRSVRYNDTTMKFFWLGKKLFGGRFLRFMSGPRNETDIVLGKPNLSPSTSKINFACPSDTMLSHYNPLGYEMCIDAGPGLIKEMIEMTSTKKSSNSYVLMFDGKKIKRGTDTDLLGYEPDPQSSKTKKYECDKEVLDRTIRVVQKAVHSRELHEDVSLETNQELKDSIRNCCEIVSTYLMRLRRANKSKEYAMYKNKEKVEKDPSMAKTLQFAIDSCRTAMYVIQNSIETLLGAQFEICKAGAFLNGTLENFACSRTIQLNEQPNVRMMKSVEETKRELDVEELPTEMIKQRSEEWFEARKGVKVTGSTIYTALGCDGLKRQNEHFDCVVSGKPKHVSNVQQRAMSHGVESEIHEIATLSSVIMPFLFPGLTYNEVGYYKQGNILVSPDGSLTNDSGSVYAVEGKAPSETSFSVRQHYSVPERYISQTLFEQKCLSAEKGTIYICWTPESTTAFIVPADEDICCKAEEIVGELYHDQVPKRRSKVLGETKDLKKKMKAHVGKCIYLGEFPSVKATDSPSSVETRQTASFHYTDLARSLLKAKTALKDAYHLDRNVASQVLVYLLADLDRYWKSEIPHAVPVMYGFRGYSLSMDIARQLLDHCWKACTDEGIDVVAASSDGEFIQLMVKGKKGQPLTLYQLSKEVWKEVCKCSKADLVKKIASVNRTHQILLTGEQKPMLASEDGVERMKTPLNAWGKISHLKEQVHQKNTDDDKGHQVSGTGQDIASECDDTLSYDHERLFEQVHDLPRPITHDEAHDILVLLQEKDKRKWKTAEGVAQKLNTSLHKFTKEELVTIARYFNMKLMGTAYEMKTTSVQKGEIVEQLKTVLEMGSPSLQKLKRQAKVHNPKSLQQMAKDVMKRNSYPKQVLNIAYATYIWPNRVRQWKESNRIADEVEVVQESENVSYTPYYVPDFDEESGEFRCVIYDKTHLGTNMRKCLILNKVKGVSIYAWRCISEERPDLLHPTIVNMSEEGKILDQMNERLARSMLTQDIEDEMTARGYEAEAEFCHILREGLYEADDTPGISAADRVAKRLALMEWLDRDVDFGKFPTYGGYIKGLSHILYEGLRSSQEAKLLLYPLSNDGTYCARAPNTLCSESFFGSMQEMDPWGQGILSGEGVRKYLTDFTTVSAMKMKDDRNIYIKTKKDTTYPQPRSFNDKENKGVVDGGRSETRQCRCRELKFIKCVIPKDHFFDSRERARVNKAMKPYRPSTAFDDLRGEQPIRKQYGYSINEARILPSKRHAIHLDEGDN